MGQNPLKVVKEPPLLQKLQLKIKLRLNYVKGNQVQQMEWISMHVHFQVEYMQSPYTMQRFPMRGKGFKSSNSELTVVNLE